MIISCSRSLGLRDVNIYNRVSLICSIASSSHPNQGREHLILRATSILVQQLQSARPIVLKISFRFLPSDTPGYSQFVKSGDASHNNSSLTLNSMNKRDLIPKARKAHLKPG
jgi:hypothetical protein